MRVDRFRLVGGGELSGFLLSMDEKTPDAYFFALMVCALGGGVAILALKDRIDRLGRDGMGKFADLKFFSFRAREGWRVTTFLFRGHHADPQTNALRITAMVMLVAFISISALGLVRH